MARKPNTSVESLGLWQRFKDLLATPVDASSLALFRISFGLVMVWQILRYLWPGEEGSKVTNLYGSVGFHLSYPGFSWVQPLPEPFLHLHFVLMALAALAVAVGLFYRWSTTILFLAYTYLFLIDHAYYNNHYYLICLVALLMIWLPANRVFSVDAWLQRKRISGTPNPDGVIPFWPVFLIRAQMFVLYFYGGIAKLGSDWITGQSLQGVGQRVVDFLSPSLPLVESIGPATVLLLFQSMGLVFDLSIGFLLIFRRTRIFGLLLTLIFHASNNFIFNIGVFPVLAFTSTLIFLEPDWPRALWTWLRRPRWRAPNWRWLAAGAVAFPVVGAALGWKARHAAALKGAASTQLAPLVPVLIVCWLGIHGLVPLRHHLIEGNPEWTHQGHHFSWRMMLKSKKSGHVKFHVIDDNLVKYDQHGLPSFDWGEFPAATPKHSFTIVDSEEILWASLPELLITYEPFLGYRVFDNPHSFTSDSEDSLAVRRAQLKQLLSTELSDRTKFTETISLEDALRRSRRTLGRNRTNREHAQEQIERIDHLFELLAKRESFDTKRVNITKLLKELLIGDESDTIHRNLARTHPFAIHGANGQQDGFLAATGLELDSGQVARIIAEHDRVDQVHLDFDRLQRNDWSGLPSVLPWYQEGVPRVVWNPASELSHLQVMMMAHTPVMIQQYAHHIADIWQEQTGRRPRVHVVSLVKMNQHPLQPIVDQRVDLASAEYRVFGQNPWILPLVRAPESSEQAASRDQSRARPRKNHIEYYPNGRKKQQVVPRGGGCFTVVQWHPNGRVSARADFRDDRPHGFQRQWHPNGRPALKMEFYAGQLHGDAIAWEANGDVIQEAHYVHGRRLR